MRSSGAAAGTGEPRVGNVAVTNGASCHPGAAVENKGGFENFRGAKKQVAPEVKSRVNQPGLLLIESSTSIFHPQWTEYSSHGFHRLARI